MHAVRLVLGGERLHTPQDGSSVNRQPEVGGTGKVDDPLKEHHVKVDKAHDEQDKKESGETDNTDQAEKDSRGKVDAGSSRKAWRLMFLLPF